MSEKANGFEKQLELQLKDLRRELRRNLDLTRRAIALAGLSVIICAAILSISLLGMEGWRDNIKLLNTASQEDLEDATEAALEDGNIGLEEAGRIATNLPEVNISEWPGDSDE